MKGDLKKLVQNVVAHQSSDFHRRAAEYIKLQSRLQKLRKLVELREDWAEKRIHSLIRHAERLGIEIKESRSETNQIEASFKGLPLTGVIKYETRGGYRTSIWTRPRIALRLWCVKSNGEKLTYEGKPAWESRRGYHVGSEALAMVFGRERLMVYNRLMVAMVNCMGK
jgi:hypothetical protein